MIRIYLSKETKEEIENKFIEDAKQSKTGLFNVLQKDDVKEILKKRNKKIYEVLYDNADKVNNDEVKNLLLADRIKMEKYIKEFKSYRTTKSKADELLENVFRYDAYSKRKVVIDILQKMKVTVCPYCNRQYIFTLSNGKARPQLDHYYPKSEYPYLSLSLYNMIPCCSVCNMAKSSLDTINTPILYPYDEEIGEEAYFEIRYRNEYVKVIHGNSDDFDIILNTDNAKNKKIIDNQMSKLHLSELYNKHNAYVQDIIKSKIVNSDEYINQICIRFPKLFKSYDEVKNLLYMTDIRKDFWGERPLSKLTHDIDKYMRKKNGK